MGQSAILGGLEGGILCTPGYNLGGKADLVLGAQPLRLLQLDASREQDPICVAISINAAVLTAFGANSDHRLMGTCRWGSKSGGGEFVFDIRHGCRMVLDASHVTLQAQLLGSVGGGSYRLNASVAYGSFSGPSSLTFTDASVGLLAGNTSAFLPIPQYARRIAIYSNSVTFTGRAELFTNNAGGAARSIFVPTNNMEPLPIPNGCEFVRFTNTDANAVSITPFYELVI
jgi:hypothetical protein